MNKLLTPMREVIKILLSIMLATGGFTFSVLADSTVKFHGTLIASSCSADAMSVEFGEIPVDQISAVQSAFKRKGSIRSAGEKMQRFALNVTCSGNISGDIKFKWNGTISSFDSDLLATDMPGLGIEIGDGDTATIIPPDTWQDIENGARTKMLLGLLLRDDTATLEGGEFNATATIAIQVP